MNQEHNSFSYTYSAEQQEEIQAIRRRYASPKADKMEELRRLDAGVTKKGSMAALIVGILSALVLGVGMCFCLVWNLFVPGILIGLPGILGICAAYPVYMQITERERQKIAPEILRLTDELMK